MTEQFTGRRDVGAQSQREANSVGRALRSALGLGAARIASAGAGTVWLILLARALGVADFGRFLVVLGVVTVVSVLTEFGAPLLLPQAIASEPRRSRSALTTMLRNRVIWTTWAVPVGAGAGAVIGGLEMMLAGVLLGVASVVQTVQTTSQAAARGTGDVRGDGSAEVLARLVTLIAGAVALAISASAVSGATAYIAGHVVAVCWIAPRTWQRTAAGTSERWGMPWRHGLALSAMAVFVTLYGRLDQWVVTSIEGAAEGGRYGAAYRLYEGLLLPGIALGAVALPVSAESPEHRRDVARRFTVAGIAIVVAIGLPLFLLGAPALDVLLGEDFRAAADELRLLCLAAVPGTVVVVLAPVVVVADRLAAVPAFAGACASSLLLNLMLVGPLGATGAGIAMVITQSSLAGYLISRVIRTGGKT